MKNNSILKNNNFIEGVLISLISIFLIIESLKLHNNKSWALSPALFPLIITISMFILSITLIIKGLKENTTNIGRKTNVKSIQLVLVIVTSFFYIIFLSKFHFLISSIVYLAMFLIILGERSWLLLALISIITPLSIQYIFGNLLDVLLP